MAPDGGLATLLAQLSASSSFEEAAAAVLRAILGLAEDALAQTELAREGRILRGVVHLRPAEGYRRLLGLEYPSGVSTVGTGYLASATAWRRIVEQPCPLSIDVHRGSMRQWLPDGTVSHIDRSFSAETPGTRDRLLGREATHVFIFPLRLPGGELGGTISVEISCKAGIGKDTLLGPPPENLGLIANLAAPYLVALPLKKLPAAAPDDLLPVVGSSTAALVELLRVFARQEETLVLRGPTGVGKSRLARWCHAQSPRSDQRFETLDLLSVPEELQMAELLGWKRGAFTGAVKDTQGAIARAADGTLFLDEIDKLSLKAQAGLLNVLEARTYRPLGDESGERRANVRFIVGTNADLLAAVRAGRFREDLYYRVNVLPVQVPSLAERVDEIPLWANYMLQRHHRERSTGEVCLADDATELLASSPWPGNLRQLDNILRRAYAFALFEGGTDASLLVLQKRHVERALLYEGGAVDEPLMAQLWKAANSFVQEAERRSRLGEPLPLELADAFRGLILGVAVNRVGDREGAFRMLGNQHLLKNRNHHRVLRRELDRVRDLSTALGGHGAEIIALLESHAT